MTAGAVSQQRENKTTNSNQSQPVGVVGSGPRARLMSFPSEAEAESFVATNLAPFCKSLVRQPVLKNGMIPDIGFRLSALPSIPLVLEIKRFEDTRIVPLPEAIAQAAQYARFLKTVAFVGPIVSPTCSAMSANWIQSPALGASLLVGGEFNVGAIHFAEAPKLTGCFSLQYAGANIAFCSFNEHGDPCTRLHPNAAHLLKHKERYGSLKWRA